MIDIDRTPLTEPQVWEHPPFEYLGHPWTTIGEDGEMAVMRGHGHHHELRAAMTGEFDLDETEYDPDDFTDAWWVFTAHEADCRADLDDDEKCGCDEYGWWAQRATEGTPGALPVTEWSL